MGQFDHFTKQTETVETITFTIPELSGTPYLIVAQASEANRPFFNALLRIQNAQRRGFRRSGQGRVNRDQLEHERERDLRLYSEHIVKDWGNITDPDGHPIAFTVENCREFLDAIPRWLFNQLRVFCQQPMNFLTDAAADYGSTAKN